jgi:hypothetical protein
VAQGPGPANQKWGRPAPQPWPAGQVLGAFPKTIFTTCQSRSVRRVSILGKAVKWLNLAARLSCMAGRPDKWASRAQSSLGAPPHSSYKNPHAPHGRECEESQV